MSPFITRHYWAEIRERAEKIIALVDEVGKFEVGDRQKHEHKMAIKIDGESAAIRSTVDDLKMGMEM